MRKPILLIVEGAQGCGKTTLTNILRDRIPYSNLMRLSGIKDGTLKGREKIFNIYTNLQEFLEKCENTNMSFIFDRTFFTERAYCMLGYKSYDFSREYSHFLERLAGLEPYYDIYLFILTAKADTLEERLKRDKPQYANVKFNVESSLNQQEAYEQLLKQVQREYPNITAYPIRTDQRKPEDIADDIIQAFHLT